MHKSHYTRDSLCHDSQVCVVCLLVTLAALVAGAMLISWWANHSDIWSSSGLLFMWSVCSCPLSDRLACSPVLLLFPSSLFSASCVCSVPVLVIDVSSLDSGRVHQQPLPSPLQSPRCQGLLTLSKTHDSDCPVYSLSTLFNKLFSAFATGFRIYFLTLSGLHKRVCCRFLYVVFINFSKYYNL